MPNYSNLKSALKKTEKKGSNPSSKKGRSLKISDPIDPRLRKEALNQKYNEIQNKNRQANALEIQAANKLKETKMNAIQQLFQTLVNNGVDPTNLQSINQFLQKLASANPELLQQFEQAFDSLTGNEFANAGPQPTGTPTPPMTPPQPQQPIKAGFSAPPPQTPQTPSAFLNAQPSGGKPDHWPPKQAPSQFQAEPPVTIKKAKKI